MRHMLASAFVAGSFMIVGCSGAQAPAAETTPAPTPAPVTADEPMESAPSLADGVYTADQADRGAVTFNTTCSGCHAPREFWGDDFMFNWEGSSVGRLYRIMSTTMPEDDPGGLTTESYMTLVAYILELNDYPTGTAELQADMDLLEALVIER